MTRSIKPGVIALLFNLIASYFISYFPLNIYCKYFMSASSFEPDQKIKLTCLPCFKKVLSLSLLCGHLKRLWVDLSFCFPPLYKGPMTLDIF